MALGSTITQVTESGLKPGLQFPSLVVSGILTSTNFKTGTTDVHSTGVTAATSVVGSAVTSNATGVIVTGVTTSNSFVGALTGNVSGGTVAGSTGTFSSDVTISGDLGVAGTLTYEDVARVDAIGLSTYREGLHIGPLAGIGLTAYKDGSIRTTGVITATTYYGSGAQLTGITGTTINNNADNRLITGSGTANRLEGEANLTFDGSTLNVVNGGAIIGGSTDADVLVRLDHEDNTGKAEFQLNAWGTASVSLVSNFSGSAVSGIPNGAFGLTTPQAKDITICTSGTERLRIDSNGDLGIGIAAVLQDSGAKTLHIHHPTSGSPARSHIRLTTGTSGSAADNGALLGLDYSNNLYLYNHEAGEVIFGSNNVKRMVLRSDGNFHISKNVNLTGNTNSNLLNERLQILPSEANGYDDSHILSAAQTSGNWEQGNSSSNASSSWGWLWQFAATSAGTKQVRAGIAYDHKGTEEFKYWSSYGDHTWYVDSGTSGDETAETCDVKAMQIGKKGGVINTAQPRYGIYTHADVQTSDGGSKTVQYLEDCMGQWIVVAKIQQSSHLQATMASVAQIDAGTGQATGTEWSASFGNTYPVAVRYVSSSNWKNWRDNRGVDFIQGVPHGRQWKNFFTNGASSGMTQATGGVGSTKYGWTCDGAWDGKGRWHNPTFNWWRMSDTANFSASMVSSTFFTTPTAANAASALDLNFAGDAKFGVHATGATGGQDTEVTSVYGHDDNVYGHEDNYPNSPANHVGSDITAMPLWICLNVSSVGQFH